MIHRLNSKWHQLSLVHHPYSDFDTLEFNGVVSLLQRELLLKLNSFRTETEGERYWSVPCLSRTALRRGLTVCIAPETSQTLPTPKVWNFPLPWRSRRDQKTTPDGILLPTLFRSHMSNQLGILSRYKFITLPRKTTTFDLTIRLRVMRNSDLGHSRTSGVLWKQLGNCKQRLVLSWAT